MSKAQTISQKFNEVSLPDGKTTYLPDDIKLAFPDNSSLGPKDLHYLAYIPWDKRLIDECVPDEYKDFFKLVLPNLHARTTDVHTARCLPLTSDLLDETLEPVNRRVVFATLILHDSGWSKLTDQQIADSLSYTGLALSKASLGPKKDHAELGVEIAKDILGKYDFSPALTKDEKELIEYIVLHHDIPKHLVDEGKVPLELFLVCDADRFWSYTHDNFWQDTVRKGVDPKTYWNNLSNELDGYFYTDQGKAIARRLLQDRKEEVSQYPA